MTAARRLRLNADVAYTLEFCKCGQHPRIMAVAHLVYAWNQRRSSSGAGGATE